MSNPSKARGTRFEREVADYLVEAGFPEADRHPPHGSVDLGDITGVPGVVIEAKNRKRLDVAGAVDEAVEEAANAGADWAWAVLSRRYKNVRDSYVVTPLCKAAEHHRRFLIYKARAEALDCVPHGILEALVDHFPPF